LQSAISALTCSCLISTASATSSSIGLVMTTGAVQIDGSRAPGSSAIFSGNLISSEDRTANLQYSDGTSAVMNAGSMMAVYREHSVLQRGVAMQRGVDKHPILADGLKISGAAANAVALVGVRDASHVEVAAQEGESDVWAPTGDLVARVEPGKSLSFAISQSTGTQENNVKLCGTLQENYQLTDDFNSVTYQLRGVGLEPFVKDTVQVRGTIQASNPPGSTPQIVTVTKIKKMDHPCVVAGAVPAAAGSIWSKGALVILIFGGLGGALIGIGITGGFGVTQPPVTPVTP